MILERTGRMQRVQAEPGLADRITTGMNIKPIFPEILPGDSLAWFAGGLALAHFRDGQD